MDIVDRIVNKKSMLKERAEVEARIRDKERELRDLNKLVKRVKLAPRFEVSFGLLQVADGIMNTAGLSGIRFAVPYENFNLHIDGHGDIYIEKVGLERYKVYYQGKFGFIQFKNMRLVDVDDNGEIRELFIQVSKSVLSFLHLLQLNPGLDKISPMAANKYRQEFGIEGRGDIYKVLKITPFKDVSYGVNGEPLQRGPVREHDVRGHIRRYKNGKEAFVRSHVRGNALIGRVVKDYKVG